MISKFYWLIFSAVYLFNEIQEDMMYGFAYSYTVDKLFQQYVSDNVISNKHMRC
jgi:hypothetical protein